MANRARRRGTYDDILALPEHLVGELVDGELIVSPRPGSRHGGAATVLAMDLGGPFQRSRGGPGGWWFIVEQELHLGPDVLVPDLAGWRRERMPAIPDVPFIELAPDWICEVLSRSNASLDRGRKMPKYARAGVKHAWLLDPADRTLEVFRRGDDGHWVVIEVFTGDAKVRAEPFEAVEMELSALWPPTETDSEAKR